jgi:23S rRNA pseudouridine1911/1915/1917 synthase
MTERSSDTVLIAAEEAGQRIDRVLAARIPTLSRSRLKALILAGQVTIEARTILDPASLVKSGDLITINLPPPEEAQPKGETIPLNIVYEDGDLIVIDKPSGLVVHPSAGHATGTLVNALIAHCGDSLSGIGGVKRPGNGPLGGRQERPHPPCALEAIRRSRPRGAAQARLSRFRLGCSRPAEGHHRRPTRPQSA